MSFLPKGEAFVSGLLAINAPHCFRHTHLQLTRPTVSFPSKSKMSISFPVICPLFIIILFAY